MARFPMIFRRMGSVRSRLFAIVGSLAIATVATACQVSYGTQRISVPKSKGALYTGAVLFNQRCSGCHTLSYAAAMGSAVNVRTAQYNNGPNFDVRCERPVTRVLYAIENGGFSGAIMPQNVVVGQQAIDVARFVATYAGRQAPKIPGTQPCTSKAIGTIPPPPSATSTTATTTTPTTTTSPATTTPAHASKPKSKTKP
jgi:mono/diheme cytochrome c family protein